MRPLYLFPALLVLFLTASQAPAGETTATMVVPDHHVHIGPKGGDTRKGHAGSLGNQRTSLVDASAAPAAVTQGTPKPWNIGPKGGYTSKGVINR